MAGNPKALRFSEEARQGIVRGVDGCKARGADEGAGACAEERCVHKGTPARGPDVEALVQVAAIQLLGDCREPLQRSGRDDEPKCGEKRWQHEESRNDAPGMAEREKNSRSGQRDDGCNESFARGREQDGDKSKRKKSERQETRRPSALAVDK